MNAETVLQNRILMHLSKMGCMVFRNETAGAWVGSVERKARDVVTLNHARFMKAGLCKGSADIIGLTSTGRFLAVEVKSANGKPSPDQIKFISNIRKQGGYAGFAYSVEDAKAIAEGKCNGL